MRLVLRVVLRGGHHRLPAVQRCGVQEQRVVDQHDRIGELVAPVDHDSQHLLQPLGAVLLRLARPLSRPRLRNEHEIEGVS